MSPRRFRRVRRASSLVAAGAVATLLATATPAAAHDVDSGSMPAPPWLLGYLAAFAVLAAAFALRATWTAARLLPVATDEAPAAPPRVGPGNVLGMVLYGLVLAAAVVGPDSPASNIAPVAVLVVWWVGIPMLSLLVGDAMRPINPFVGVVGLLRPARDDGEEEPRVDAPPWLPAAFLAGFGWFFVAYHGPGSPRAVAVLLVVYAAAAVGLGLRWGPRWLARGEGFGALAAAVSILSPLRRGTPPPGTAAVVVVWLGSIVFDGFASTELWQDVVAGRRGWELTAFSTAGLVWITALVAGAYLAAVWAAERPAGSREEAPDPRAGDGDRSLRTALGVALVPVAVAWFVGHDLTLLLFEGQNFLALLSDPIARGWELVPPIEPDYALVKAGWVPWVQVGAVVAGPLIAVVVAHDVVRGRPPRQAVRLTWGVAGAAAVSAVASALLVLG